LPVLTRASYTDEGFLVMPPRSEDQAPPAAGAAPEPRPSSAKGAEARSSFDRTLILATVAIAAIAALLLAAALVIESGFEQLRKEAFPLPEEAAHPGGSRSPPSTLLPPKDAGEPTAFLGLDLQHSLSSGLLSVYLDDRLVHEAPLSSRPRRVFLFRVAPQGEVRFSVPVEPGLRRVALRILSDELPAEAAAEANAEFQEREWRLLLARLRLNDGVLETRWGQ